MSAVFSLLEYLTDWYGDTYSKQVQGKSDEALNKSTKVRRTTRLAGGHNKFQAPPERTPKGGGPMMNSRSNHDHAHEQTLLHNGLAVARVEHCPHRKHIHIHTLETKGHDGWGAEAHNGWGVQGHTVTPDGKRRARNAHHEHTKAVLKAVRDEVIRSGAKSVSTTPANPKVASLFMRMGGKQNNDRSTIVVRSDRFLRRFLHEAEQMELELLTETSGAIRFRTFGG